MPKKILVVDDERHIVRLIQVNLERAGYEVVTAMDSRGALQKAEWEPPDLIIVDAMLSNLNQLLAGLRQNPRTCDIRILKITEPVDWKDVFDAFRKS